MNDVVHPSHNKKRADIALTQDAIVCPFELDIFMKKTSFSHLVNEKM